MSRSHHQNNIKLEEAMTMSLTQNIRIWDISGLHVEDKEIPENANVQTTFVMKPPEGNIQLGVQWTVEGELWTNMSIVAEVSTLNELKVRFPKLFELKGSLYAFA